MFFQKQFGKQLVTAVFSFVLCAILLATGSNAQWAIDDEGCRTPDRGVGTCILINECQHILDFLTNSPKPLSAAARKTLRDYQCGFDASNVKVCCPGSPIPIKGGNGGAADPSKPPDVSNHRNFNLLPIKDCGHLPNDDRLLGGNKTSLFEFPWMVLLSYQTSRGPDFRCGATLINNRYVLTAAHCITNLGTLSLLGIRVGEHDINKEKDCEIQDEEEVCAPPVQDIAIEKTIPHPLYNNPPFQHDIGLIRLATPVNTGLENARPVCLPVTDATRNFNFANQNVVVTGWGATETGRKSQDLLKVEIPIIPFNECRQTYTRQANLTQRQLCAGGKNQKDSCQGDSGGPLHVVGVVNNDARYVQQGIVSFGPKICGTENNPGVYTKVSFYMDWVLDNMTQ